MRVTFTIDPFAAHGGGSVSFAGVLAEALPTLGVEVGFDLERAADVLLVFAHHATERLLIRHRRRGARIVHRLDERIDAVESPARRAKHRTIAQLNAYADLTVFQSWFVRDSVGPICWAPTWCVIYNGVDRRRFRPDGPRISLEGDPALLHVSWSVGESKRLDRIGELLAAAPAGSRLHCVGRHAETGMPWLADPRVNVLGPLGRDEVATIMRSADVLFFPSELEPCPNTPLEAIASGLPCLYHPSGGTSELMSDAGVPMGSCLRDDLAQVLAQRPRLRARALARAAEFGSERAASAYASAMREALARAPSPGPSTMRRLWTLCGF